MNVYVCVCVRMSESVCLHERYAKERTPPADNGCPLRLDRPPLTSTSLGGTDKAQ